MMNKFIAKLIDIFKKKRTPSKTTSQSISESSKPNVYKPPTNQSTKTTSVSTKPTTKPKAGPPKMKHKMVVGLVDAIEEKEDLPIGMSSEDVIALLEQQITDASNNPRARAPENAGVLLGILYDQIATDGLDSVAHRIEKTTDARDSAYAAIMDSTDEQRKMAVGRFAQALKGSILSEEEAQNLERVYEENQSYENATYSEKSDYFYDEDDDD